MYSFNALMHRSVYIFKHTILNYPKLNIRTMSSSLRFGVCQMAVHPTDKNANINVARKSIRKAAVELESNLVMLPECWNSPYATKSFPEYSEVVPDMGENGASCDPTLSPSSFMLCQASREFNVWLIGGSIPERYRREDGTDLFYNSCIMINPEGIVVGKHRKMHLFDINIDKPIPMVFKESDTLSAGDSVTIVQTPWGGVGLGICYDIRFPELAILMRQKGARILAYPSAFNMVTGPAHWSL